MQANSLLKIHPGEYRVREPWGIQGQRTLGNTGSENPGEYRVREPWLQDTHHKCQVITGNCLDATIRLFSIGITGPHSR